MLLTERRRVSEPLRNLLTAPLLSSDTDTDDAPGSSEDDQGDDEDDDPFVPGAPMRDQQV